MAFRLFIDSSNGVTLYPEWDMLDSAKKEETVHRTRGGNRFVYKFGEYKKLEINVMWVNSEFKSIVNSWWNTNTELLFKSESETQVHSVMIVNAEQPISNNMMPYIDEFSGTINLETY